MYRSIIILAIIILTTVAGYAGSTLLSGKFMQKGNQKAVVVLLYGDLHYKIPSIEIIADEHGNYSTSIDLPHPLFAVFKFNGIERKILLSEGRPLYISIDTLLEEPLRFSGLAAEENILLSETVIQVAPRFAMGKWDASSQSFIEEVPYTKLKPEEFGSIIMQPIEKKIALTDKKLHQSAIPVELQSIIASEIRYAYQCYLNDFTGTMLRWVKHPSADSLNKLIIAWQPLPDEKQFESGFYANMSMRMHMNSIFTEVVEAPGEGNPYERITAFLGTNFESVDSLVKLYGENPVLPWLFARSQLTPAMQEKILFNKILYAASNDYPSVLKYLADSLNILFPDSYYRNFANKLLNDFEKKLSEAGKNPAINFHSSEAIHSIASLVEPYKGRIIYLDVWGIWCGPCRIEMEYTSDLKERFKNREDIVFLYLHTDDDIKIPEWKEYVFLKNVEGEHYHMNSEHIQPIWNEIEAAGGKPRLYPTYLIIDADGKIITTGAERPSSKENLYRQLEEMMN